jgi:transcriptional regulator with GAF, ATPase, and Fis domain
MTWDDSIDGSDSGYESACDRVTADLKEIMENRPNPQALFTGLSRSLLQEYDIKKGFLALREGDQTRFLAVAAFKEGRTQKNLSLRLPNVSSLFEKVAESGQIFSENFAALFDGNYMERQLLLDDDTASFMLRPLKCDTKVVGLIGFSSETSEAFVTMEEGLLDPVFDRVAAYLAQVEVERDENQKLKNTVG